MDVESQNFQNSQKEEHRTTLGAQLDSTMSGVQYHTKYQAKYKALNEAPPTGDDHYNDKCLESFMRRNIVLESDANMKKRNDILEEIKRMFVTFIQKVAKSMNMSEDEAANAGGLIFISGSHRLNVREPGADIDTVCVAPAFVNRDHFFSILKEDLVNHRDVEELNAVETAHVPVMELEFSGVSIDLLFARMSENVVKDDLDILDDDVLRNLDSATEKSLNGPRVTDMISKLVPNYDTFLIVLRCARKWAKARGLYGNKFGYLGGVNFNILVAFVGHLYPNGSPSFLLNKFFTVYSKWNWENPIELIEARQSVEGEDRQVWSQNQLTQECMPIITPAYPAMNSSYNVNLHGREVMVTEWRRGAEIIKSINDGFKSASKKLKRKLPDDDTIDEAYNKLFEPSDFFVKYHHYLRCNIIGGQDEGPAISYIGFVESRLRRLVTFLDPLPILAPIHLHPVKHKMPGNSVCYFVGFNANTAKLRRGEKEIFLDKAINKFKMDLEKYTGPKSSIEGDQCFVTEHYLWKHLPKEVFDSLGGPMEAKKLRREIYPKVQVDVATADAPADGEAEVKEDGDVSNKLAGEEEDATSSTGGGVKRSADEAALDTGDQPADTEDMEDGPDGLLVSSDIRDQNLITLFATDNVDTKPVVSSPQRSEIHHVKWKLLDLK